MADNLIPKTDVISPAEARFWDEWAGKAPELIRHETDHSIGRLARKAQLGTIISMVVGAVLGGASFTKHVPGKWKILTGAGAGFSAVASYTGSVFSNALAKNAATYHQYADALEKTPELKQSLAHYLSANVTGEEIQQIGLEMAVIKHSLAFGMDTPYLQGHAATAIALKTAGSCEPCRTR